MSYDDLEKEDTGKLLNLCARCMLMVRGKVPDDLHKRSKWALAYALSRLSRRGWRECEDDEQEQQSYCKLTFGSLEELELKLAIRGF